MKTLSLVAMAVLALAGCDLVSSGPVAVVDGWPIGRERPCAIGDARCTDLMPVAINGFDRRDPGHAPIVRATLHDEGTMIDAQGNHILMTRSGACCSVALFELSDGSVRAIGVGYPGVSDIPVAIETGP